jgi:3-dehydroquinate synthase
LAGYGYYTHGEAVAIGTAVAAQLGVQLGMLSREAADKITSLLRQAGLPTTVPAELAAADIITAMYGDKRLLVVQ